MPIDFTQPLAFWAYLLLAIVVILEGPIATLAGAVAASTGLMNPYLVFLTASAGNLASDILWYMLGSLGKTKWLFRKNRLFHLRQDQVERLEEDIHQHAPRMLFMAKLTLGFAIPALIATGLAHVPLRRWFFVLILGETLWTGTLTYLGYHFGRYLHTLERGVEIVALVGSMVFASVIIYYISSFRRRLKAKE